MVATGAPPAGGGVRRDRVRAARGRPDLRPGHGRQRVHVGAGARVRAARARRVQLGHRPGLEDPARPRAHERGRDPLRRGRARPDPGRARASPPRSSRPRLGGHARRRRIPPTAGAWGCVAWRPTWPDTWTPDRARSRLRRGAAGTRPPPGQGSTRGRRMCEIVGQAMELAVSRRTLLRNGGDRGRRGRQRARAGHGVRGPCAADASARRRRIEAPHAPRAPRHGRRPSVYADRAGISSALVVDGAVYLIDCGHGAPRRFVQAGLGTPTKPGNRAFEGLKGIFLTHLHSDHTVEFPGFQITGMWNGLGRPDQAGAGLWPGGSRRPPAGLRQPACAARRRGRRSHSRDRGDDGLPAEGLRERRQRPHPQQRRGEPGRRVRHPRHPAPGRRPGAGR